MINSLIPKIIDNYEYFTHVEQKIADYFIDNREYEDFSINTMIEKLYISKSSLTRFAKKLGFRGYREFIYQYEHSFTYDYSDYSSLKVIQIYKDILKAFEKNIDVSQIERICDYIASSSKTLIIGIGSSGLAGEEMKRRFIRLGEVIESCDQKDLMKMQSIFQNKDNLVIGISLSGKTSEVLFSLKQAYYNQAKTVLITTKKQYLDYIDEYVIVPAINDLDAGNIISPQFPILVYIDLLYNSYLNTHKNKLELYKKTLEAIGR